MYKNIKDSGIKTMKAGRLFVGIKNTQVMLSVCVILIGLLMVSMSAQGLVTVTKQIIGLDENGYFVNGTSELSVQVTISYDGTEGTISALGYQETIPVGFSYLGPLASENPTLPVVPNLGQTGTLGFAYYTTPSFPTTFIYRIACPPAICEPGQLVGKVLYRLAGPELQSAPATNVIQLEPTNLTFSRELSGPGISGANRNYYIPGQNIDVTIHIDKEGPQDITAVGFQDTLPAGWTYVGLADTGTPPPEFPSEGQTNLLEFAYVSVPVFPVEFTYTVQVPNDFTGSAVIGGDIVVGTERKSSAVVYRTCGDSIFSPKVETLLKGVVPCILVSRSFTHNYYVPGEVVEVTINFRINPDHPCEGMVSALGYEETIPTGWTYEGPLATENPTPPIVPNYGATGTLSFAYIYVPTLTGNGSSFTYRIIAAADSSGPQQISGFAKYRLSGGELQSDVAVSELINYIPDTPPEITLLGDPEVSTECGSAYNDAGATATDISDGDLTAQIIVTNNANIAVVGDYTVDYSVTDSSNHTTTAQKIVHVIDTTPPVITLLGDNPVVLQVGDSYVEPVPVATAEDICDDNAEVQILSSNVDTTQAGTYRVVYQATDSSSNLSSQAIREVLVYETEGVRTVKGQVINSISRKPVAGVSVEISIADIQGTTLVLTDAYGRFEFPDLGALQPPYRLDFTKRKYQPKTVQSVESGADLTVELEPGNIQTPVYPPRVYGGPRSVRIAWEPNTEYNIAGYNVYRRAVAEDGSILVDWNKLNTSKLEAYVGYIDALEYIDETVELSTYYEYAIQAVSDVDRSTELSPPSERVKSQYLTIFFPEQVNYKDIGLFILQRANTQEIQVRIPVSSKSVYNVSATSIQIDSELPGDLLSPSTIDVEPSGITAGMMMASNATLQEDKINVHITASGADIESLYGSGTLFNIIAKPNIDVLETQCGLLHLIPDDEAGNGVRLYDVIADVAKPLEVDLEDGQLCATGGCIHGDANNDEVVDSADIQYILDYWVGDVSGNDCIMKSGDINLDGMVDNADSTLIQRWLEGMNITPPKMEIKGYSKSYDEYVQDLMWLADAGSMSAETILANVEKADAGVNIWLSNNLIGQAGTQKTISVLADNVSNVSGFNMVLNFDKELAQVDSVELGSAATDLQLGWNDDEVNTIGSLRVSAAGKENIGLKGEGVELLKIQFTMIGEGGNAELELAQVQINDIYAYVPMFDDPKVPKILPTETSEGEGTTEGALEGSPEGITEGEGTAEGSLEGTTEGTLEGSPEGITEGEGTTEGTLEGTIEGEGTTEGALEGTTEGQVTNKINVPNVVGMTEEEAKNTITAAGLKVGEVIEDYNDIIPKGSVISQNPTVGTLVDPDTAVNLVISKGPKSAGQVAVPDVIGMTKEEASNAITSAGLKVGTVTEDYSDNKSDKGKVIKQQPTAETQVDPGTAVNLVISKGKKRHFIFSCGESNSDSGNPSIADVMLIGLVSSLLLVNMKNAKKCLKIN